MCNNHVPFIWIRPYSATKGNDSLQVGRMANEVTLGSELIKQIPLVIGALIALVATLTNTVLSDKKADKREQRLIKQQRLEAIARVVVVHDEWICKLHNHKLFNEDNGVCLSPLLEEASVLALYFSELSPSFNDLRVVDLELRKLISERFAAQIGKPFNGTEYMHEFQPGWKECYASYLEKRGRALDECGRLMREE
jgi:hypothetical protein